MCYRAILWRAAACQAESTIFCDLIILLKAIQEHKQQQNREASEMAHRRVGSTATAAVELLWLGSTGAGPRSRAASALTSSEQR